LINSLSDLNLSDKELKQAVDASQSEEIDEAVPLVGITSKIAKAAKIIKMMNDGGGDTTPSDDVSILIKKISRLIKPSIVKHSDSDHSDFNKTNIQSDGGVVSVALDIGVKDIEDVISILDNNDNPEDVLKSAIIRYISKCPDFKDIVVDFNVEESDVDRMIDASVEDFLDDYFYDVD